MLATLQGNHTLLLLFFYVQIIKVDTDLLGEWEWGTATAEAMALLMAWEAMVSSCFYSVVVSFIKAMDVS